MARTCRAAADKGSATRCRRSASGVHRARCRKWRCASRPSALFLTRVPHVFVESNWLFSFAAPAHHQVPAAAELFERARRGEFTLHMPNVCIGEARQAIMTKCQPRHEANALRRFLSWSEPAGVVTKADAETVRAVLEKYKSSVKRELDQLDSTFKKLAELAYLNLFGLDNEMLELATSLAL